MTEAKAHRILNETAGYEKYDAAEAALVFGALDVLVRAVLPNLPSHAPRDDRPAAGHPVPPRLDRRSSAGVQPR